MIPLNNKILFELLPEEKQPKRSVLVPDADTLKLVIVLEVGDKVSNCKKNDIVTLHISDILSIDDSKGYCTDSNLLFINGSPQLGKTHIQPLKNEKLSKLNKAKVIVSNDKNLNKNDTIGYRKGNGLILPDHTEIISDNQIFFKV